MKIGKKDLIEGFNILNKIPTFQTPLYDYDANKSNQNTAANSNPSIKSVKSFSGNYSTKFEVSPTIQQRLNTQGNSLSAKQRGVPEDKSKELYTDTKDQYQIKPRVWINPLYRGVGTKQITYYDRQKIDSNKIEPNQNNQIKQPRKQ
jgi:hypothetical protein